jgi:hypothetical protein
MKADSRKWQQMPIYAIDLPLYEMTLIADAEAVEDAVFGSMRILPPRLNIPVSISILRLASSVHSNFSLPDNV